MCLFMNRFKELTVLRYYFVHTHYYQYYSEFDHLIKVGKQTHSSLRFFPNVT